MKIYATLEIISSRSDSAGNCCWAFRYTDHDTGNVVEAKISGGESNIDAIRNNMGRVDGWDNGIQTQRTELKIREFDRLTKNWEHAGCSPDDLAKFIRSKLRSYLMQENDYTCEYCGLYRAEKPHCNLCVKEEK